MSTPAMQNQPTAHPERKPGQRWRCEYSPGNVVEAMIAADDGIHWMMDNGDRWLKSRWNFSTMTLLSEAPAPASRAGCKTWCGGHWPGSIEKDGHAWWSHLGCATGPSWCSAMCRDAKYPPVEAPAEALLNQIERDKQSIGDLGGLPRKQPAQPKPCCRVAGLSGGRSHYSDCKGAVIAVPQGGSITTPWISLKPAQPKVAAIATQEPSAPRCPSCHMSPCLNLTGCKSKVAAKVEPVCRLKGIGPHVCGGPTLERVLPKLPRGLYCETAMFTREASVEQLTQRRHIVPSIDAIRNAPPKPGPLPVCEDLWALLGEDLR